MKILLIAPFPPPLTGHSLASEVFLKSLSNVHETEIVDLSVGSASNGAISRRRVIEVLKLLQKVRRGRGSADAIYITISESVAGNLKDLAIYALCAGRLASMVVHLHGGSIKKLLFDRYPLLRTINRAFIRRMGGAIVSGRSHVEIFAEILDRGRIHIVPNFALDNLFVPEHAVRDKFTNVEPLRVLYLSGMTAGKGYQDLATAFMNLSDELKRRITIDFAGKFESESERERFVSRIAGVRGLRYHGLVDEDQKRLLFAQSHVFCLPTSMNEGQPISILEAYASGCVVLTTGQDGIRDVFTHGINGFEFQQQSPSSLGKALETVVAARQRLEEIGLRNRALAEAEFRTAKFNARLRRILESAVTRTTFSTRETTS